MGPKFEATAYIKKIDMQLNSVMRVISGTVKSIRLQWLPVLVNIKPSYIGKKNSLVKFINKTEDHKRSLLYQMMLQPPDQR